VLFYSKRRYFCVTLRKNLRKKELQKKIKEDGIALGMCDKYRDNWGEPDIRDLCRFFHAGQDFCIEHDFPKLELLQEYADDIAPHGIWAKDGHSVDQPHVVVVGDADVIVETSIVSSIYVRHNATVRLIINEGAYCYVTAQDNCTVILECKSLLGQVKMSYYSGTIIGEEHFDKINNK
jgi:hypothetical protein